MKTKWLKEIKDIREKMNIAEMEQKLHDMEEKMKILFEENKQLQKKYDKLYSEHQSYLKRKKVHKLNKGKCVYLVNVGTDENMMIRIGKTEDIFSHLSNIWQIHPYCKLLFLVYTPWNNEIEENIKKIYENETSTCRNIIHGVSLDNVKDRILDMTKVFGMEYRVETEEEIQKFNAHIVSEKPEQTTETKTDEDPPCTTTKRCGGLTHKTEEERVLPLSAFSKNKSNSDGYARLCKECYLTGVYGDNRKRQKVVVIPAYNTTTHKWCNRCESVKKHEEFHNSSSTKDGLMSNCKACKAEQKQNKKKQQHEQQTNPQTIQGLEKIC